MAELNRRSDMSGEVTAGLVDTDVHDRSMRSLSSIISRLLNCTVVELNGRSSDAFEHTLATRKGRDETSKADQLAASLL